MNMYTASDYRRQGIAYKTLDLLGGQSILFDPATLDKKEDIKDVCGYLQNWADAMIVRYKDIDILERMASIYTSK